MVMSLLYQIKGLLLICVGLFGIGLLIGFHEFGHYLFARMFGVRAPSFSIGMGPKLFSFKLAGTEFKLSAIPLGGYVEIAGLAEIGQGEQEHAQATDAGSFSVKPFWQKAFILSGGILFNILFAYIIFSVLFFVGMPQSVLFHQDTVRPIIKTIEKNSSAEKVALAAGDEIIAINSVATPHIKELITQLRAHKNQEIALTLKRQEKIDTIKITPDKHGRLGISFVFGTQAPLSLTKSLYAAAQFTGQITHQVIQVFINLFKNGNVQDLGGPLLIISQMAATAKQGIVAFLFFLAFISLNLVILNLIPLPITDGGQLLLTGIEAAIRHSIPEKIKLGLYYVSWGLILLLTLYLTVKDSIFLFWPTIKSWFVKP